VSDKNPTVSQNSQRQPDPPLAGQRQLLIYRHTYSLYALHFCPPDASNRTNMPISDQLNAILSDKFF
jgi:hypothetical protein